MSNLIDANELYIRIREQVKSPAIVGCLGGIIAEVPTFGLDDLRPKGRWIAQDETLTKFMCSVCASKNYGGYEKFCPHCGADMSGGFSYESDR